MPSTVTASPPRVDPPLSSSGRSHASSVSDASWSLTQWPSVAPASLLDDGGVDEWISVAEAAAATAAENHDIGCGVAGAGEEFGDNSQDQKFQEEAHWTSFQRAIQSFAAKKQEAVTRQNTDVCSGGKKNANAGTRSSIVPSQHAIKTNSNRVQTQGDSSNACAKDVKLLIQETGSINIQDSKSANREDGKDQGLN
jgi:hypothetical protein